MTRYSKPQPGPTASRREHADTVRTMAATTERLGLATVPATVPAAIPAAWPTGVSQLAQAIDACQRCDTAVVCTDWLKRAPNSIVMPPDFCPNAPAFKRAKPAKERG